MTGHEESFRAFRRAGAAALAGATMLHAPVTRTGIQPRPGGGIVLYAPRFYDFLAWAVMFGREGAFREKVIDLAHPKPGESVSINREGFWNC